MAKVVDRIWVWVEVNADGEEGIVGFFYERKIMVPMVSSRPGNLAGFDKFAQLHAIKFSVRVERRRFDGSFEIERTFTDGTTKEKSPE